MLGSVCSKIYEKCVRRLGGNKPFSLKFRKLDYTVKDVEWFRDSSYTDVSPYDHFTVIRNKCIRMTAICKGTTFKEALKNYPHEVGNQGAMGWHTNRAENTSGNRWCLHEYWNISKEIVRVSSNFWGSQECITSINPRIYDWLSNYEW